MSPHIIKQFKVLSSKRQRTVPRLTSLWIQIFISEFEFLKISEILELYEIDSILS